MLACKKESSLLCVEHQWWRGKYININSLQMTNTLAYSWPQHLVRLLLTNENLVGLTAGHLTLLPCGTSLGAASFARRTFGRQTFGRHVLKTALSKNQLSIGEMARSLIAVSTKYRASKRPVGQMFVGQMVLDQMKWHYFQKWDMGEMRSWC